MAAGETKVSLMTYLASVPDDAKIYVVVPGDTTPYYTTKAALFDGVVGGGVVSVNGNLVNNADPENPVINIPSLSQLLYSGGDRSLYAADLTGFTTFDIDYNLKGSALIIDTADSDITFLVKTGSAPNYVDGMEYIITNLTDYVLTFVADTGVTLDAESLVIPKNATAHVRFIQDTFNSRNIGHFAITYEFGELPSISVDSVPTDGSANAVSSNGVFDALANKADLVSGFVPSSQLPAYVDDILDGYYVNSSQFDDESFVPYTPARGKIYVDLNTNTQYRWTGTSYIQITNGAIASTSDVPEGSNLYFTAARVLATVLTGISFATGGAIVSTDTVLQAFGKIQKQINDLGSTYQALSTKDATGGYVGMTLFKINFKNAANTFTSFFTNSNTAARTYTFQDRNGTIADDTDISGLQSQLNNKVKIVIHDATTTTGINSTTSETIISSNLILANTFAATDVMNLVLLKLKSNGSGGTINYKVYVNTANSLSGAVQIATVIQSNTSMVTSTIGPKSYTFSGGNLEGLFGTSNDVGVLSTTALGSTTLNPAANFYIIVTGQLGTLNTNNARQTLLYITN